MKIIVTCGPSYEPIDQARRLTNFSTGKLGVTLSNLLTQHGHEVICLRGEGSTFPGLVRARWKESFRTNEDLAERLSNLARYQEIDAVLHAAALCDYRVEDIQNGSGESVQSAKIATRDGRLHLTLTPAIKILPRMREWFPRAWIAGWKYELVGGPSQAFEKAWRQIQECQTNACVLNGAAYGNGFAVCASNGQVHSCSDSTSLFQTLLVQLQAFRDAQRCVAEGTDWASQDLCKVCSCDATQPA